MLCAEPDLMGSRQTGVRVRPASKDMTPVGFRGIEQCLADLLRFRRRDAFQPAPICRGRLRFEASPIFQERVSRGKLGSLRLGRGCRFQMHVFFRNVAFRPDSQAIRRSAVFCHLGKRWLGSTKIDPGSRMQAFGATYREKVCTRDRVFVELEASLCLGLRFRVVFSGCMSKAASMGFAVFEPAMRRRRDRELRSLLAG